MNAEELQNYTHVDGIYTANPDLVPDAKKIDYLTFNEANELANAPRRRQFFDYFSVHKATNVSKDGPKKIVAILGLEIGDRKPRYGCMLPERAKKFGKT